jgi:hypothetical protein
MQRIACSIRRASCLRVGRLRQSAIAFLALLILMVITQSNRSTESRRMKDSERDGTAAGYPSDLRNADSDLLPPRKTANDRHPPIVGIMRHSRISLFGQGFDRLAANADAGDRLSSCLLSRALALCWKEDDQNQIVELLMRRAAKSRPGSVEEAGFIKQIATLLPEDGARSPLCRGLSNEHLREKDARMLQAARLGDPVAMTHFALRSRTSDMRDDASQGIDNEYRAHAIEFLDRSASMGDETALWALFNFHLHGASPNGGRLIVSDGDSAAALAVGDVLLQRVDDAQRLRIESLLAEKGISIETVDSGRYAALKKKYLGYQVSSPIESFEDSIENADVESCWGP